MKVIKAELYMFSCGNAVPNKPVAIRLYTDEGIYGDGEASLSYGKGAEGAYGMLQSFIPLVLGMNPLSHEVIWDKMHKTTFWGQSGGPAVYSAMSAIDIALWDIKGKFYNAPIYQLLGGKHRNELRCYASQLQLGWGDKVELEFSIDDYVRVSKRAVAEGYDAIKIDFMSQNDLPSKPMTYEQRKGLLPPKTVRMVENRVAAVREAVGEDVDIIIENHSQLDALSAIQIAQATEKYNIFYFEEPNTPSPKTARYLRDRINIPIANGERIFGRWQYAPYFEDMSIQVAQPDLTSCGGLTEGKKICDMAHTYDIGIQAHVCGTPLSTALSLHLEASIPNFVIHEHHILNLFKPVRDLCIYDYQPVNGVYTVPELPGIGNEWSEKALAEALRKETFK
jgi:L-alanine-DL-glutamate epimerase-like enolase superfamily enzyme